jgi:methionyl-tRNA formyltransferase
VRLVFMGSPDFAVPALRALHQAGHEIAAVYCQPPRPAGRGQAVRRCAVHQAADALGLAVRTPARLRRDADVQRDFAALGAEAAVVAAYGLILPGLMLTAPRRGCLNIHASLLPRWRGAAPIQAAILAGDAETGISIMQMDEGLDTGDMLLIEREAIRPDDTTAALHDRLATLGGRLIVEALELAACGGFTPEPQPAEGISYAHKIEKAEAAIDWRLPAAVIDRRVRAFDPFPGATFALNGETVKLWRTSVVPASGTPGEVLHAQGDTLVVACGEQALALHTLQRPGGKRVAVREFLQAVGELPTRLA